MANGPFGNPLSTGIALSGVIDIVTPVRQAEERKRQREAAEKKERDQRAKELGAIMGKIAIDEDKIWWRYHDDARLQYADTIDKVQQMYSAGDYAGMYKTINQFDTKMANYIQATNQKNKWEDSVRKGDKYYDQTYLNALENRDVDMPDLVKIADESGFGAYDPNTNILGFIDPVQRIDLREKVKKAIDGQKYMYEKQGKSLKVSGYGASGEPVYEMSLQDRQGTIDAVKKSIQPQAVPYMLMEMGYSKEDQLKMTPQELDQRLNEAIENTYNLYATKEERGSIPKDTGKKGSGMTFEEKYTVSDFSEKIKDTQLSGIPSGTEMVGKAFNPKVDIKSTAKGGVYRLVTVSPDSYESIDGKPIRKPVRSGETITINMVPMGIVALKGSKDNRVFASYRYVTGGGSVPERIHMHYEPLNRDNLKDKNNVEFRDYAGLTDDEFVSYYNEVAGMAGFPKFKGGTSTTGTQSSGYAQITTLKDSSGNLINAGVKGGKWYNIDTGEEIK